MIEEWMRKDSKDDKGRKWGLDNNKVKYLLVIIISLGLLALIWPSTKVADNTVHDNISNPTPAASSVKDSITSELEAILGQIDGAGQVSASISLSSEGIKTYASNMREETRDTEEADNRGVKKNTTEHSITRDLAVSSGAPLLIEEKQPEILGVLIVAEGAKNPSIAEKLLNATTTLLNISSHKVTVMPRKGDL